MLGELLAARERAEPSDVREELPFFDRERERAVLGASVAMWPDVALDEVGAFGYIRAAASVATSIA